MIMTSEAILQSFKQTVCAEVRLLPEGIDRYRVFSPFTFSDGDHFSIVLKRDGLDWILSDEGHTMMHLSYRMEYRDIMQGNRGEIISDLLSMYGIEDRGGEFIHVVPGEQYGDALFQMVQGLLRISDISFLSRELVRSTFREDVFAYIESLTPISGRFVRGWHDSEHDPEGKYKADGYLNTLHEPIVLFILQNDIRVKDATINLLQYEKWGLSVHSLAIFENQESINRKALARLSDVCDKMFSSYTGNKDRIGQYIVNEGIKV
jgi:hypothetical protein